MARGTPATGSSGTASYNGWIGPATGLTSGRPQAGYTAQPQPVPTEAPTIQQAPQVQTYTPPAPSQAPAIDYYAEMEKSIKQAEDGLKTAAPSGPKLPEPEKKELTPSSLGGFGMALPGPGLMQDQEEPTIDFPPVGALRNLGVRNYPPTEAAIAGLKKAY